MSDDPHPEIEPVRFLTERQLAKALNVSLALVRRWRVIDAGPAYVKMGGKLVRYDWKLVEQWLASQPTGGGK